MMEFKLTIRGLRILRTARIFLAVAWLSSYYSYRAMFAWASPKAYLGTKVLFPLMQTFAFAMIGTMASGNLSNVNYYIIGNAFQTIGISGLFGVMMSIGGERPLGTLPFLLTTPANRFSLFVGKAVVHLVDAAFGVVLNLIIFTLFFSLDIAPQMMPILLIALLTISFSISGLGILLGGLSFLTRDIFLIANSIYWGMIVVCGVNFPVSILPAWLQVISYSLPLTRGLQAVRLIIGEGESAQIAALLLQEFTLGIAYIAVGYFIFIRLEKRAKRSGTLEEF